MISSETSRRGFIKHYIFSFVESIWRSGFYFVGLIDRRRPFIEPERCNILVVAPHPDDETAAAGGTIMRHQEAGAEITVVIVTDGRSSKAGGLDTDAMIEQRRNEVLNASGILRIRMKEFLLPEGGWQPAVFRKELRPYIDKADIVYTPSWIDFHPEHLKVAECLAEMVSDTQIIRTMQLGVPLGSKRTNCLVDITFVAERKEAAIAAYKSQLGALKPLQRTARYLKARYGRSVESFWQATGAEFKKQMRNNSWTGGYSSYRGIRPRPFTDPLAWIIGKR